MMKERIIDGYRFSYQEAVDFFSQSSDEEILSLARDLRRHYYKRRVSTCMIMNAKSGRCSENCKWCAQSAHFKSKVPYYDLVDAAEALKFAKEAQEAKVNRFSLVTSGRNLSPRNIEKIAGIYATMKKEVPNVHYCASLGLVSKDDLVALYAAGVRRYHCNIETAPSFFSHLCNTHTIEDKVKTIRAAQELGMTICSGGILGMGETMEQRIEMAVFLAELKVDSIPINILLPQAGTPLGGMKPLREDEILRSIAIFRIINPKVDIRICAGRVKVNHVLEQVFDVGISSTMVGNLLTTVGSSLEEDLEFIEEYSKQELFVVS